MTRYPNATWRGPVPNETPHGMVAHRGIVLHIQEGTEAGTDSWVHNPASEVSAHFGNPKTGGLVQWVDLDDRAWAEVNGNPYWISVENEGYSGDALTPSQLENVAQLLAWAHNLYGVPLQVSDSTVPGLTGHSCGGAAWGGHYQCPGQHILDQRPQIIGRAAQILNPQEADMDMNTQVSYPTGMRPYFNSIEPGLGDEIAAVFPLGGTAGFGVTAAYTAASARAAAFEGANNGRLLSTVVQQLGAVGPALTAIQAALNNLNTTMAKLAAAEAAEVPPPAGT